jgi:HSP20 family molecular chaperone IbpA
MSVTVGEEDERMNGRSRNWMWADAVDLLDRVQRLHQQTFAPARAASGGPNWEPPADMLETPHEVLVLIALPGVDLEQTEALIEDGTLIVRGQRVLPPELRTAKIHRLELPQGCFERRLALPEGRYDGVHRSSANGCLLVTLHKGNARGTRL